MKSLLVLITLMLPLLGIANEDPKPGKSGTIVYEETMQMKIHFEGNDEHFKDMIPKSRSVLKALVFNEGVSLYKDASDSESGEIEINSEDGGAQWQMKMVRPEYKYYKNIEEGTKTEMREFMGKRFLIKGEIPTQPWKLGEETEEVLGYTCKKASYSDEEGTIVAYYTSDLPISNGPAQFGGLPGLILKLDMDDGNRVLVAKKIDFEDAEEIQEPTKGKEVSQEEFDEIVEAKMKEMGAEKGGRGIMKVITIDEEQH